MGNGRKHKIKIYLLAIAIPVATGLLSTLLTKSNMDTYTVLKAPQLAPPAFIFPVVWSVLYVLMGISSAMVWINRSDSSTAEECGLKTYGISLFFNFTWSLLFFNLRWFLFAFLWLAFLLYLILRTILAYQKISLTASVLQIPYAIWVTFAGYLNISIWYLNR